MLIESVLHAQLLSRVTTPASCPLSLPSISPPLPTQRIHIAGNHRISHIRSYHQIASSSSADMPDTQSGDKRIIALHEATSAKIDAISAQMSQTSAQITRLGQDPSDFKSGLARAQTSLSLRINNAENRLLAAIADANAPTDASTSLKAG
jgi:hypothetical protein